MIRIAIADDSAELRTALRLLTKLYKHIELVGEATDGQEALDCVERLLPDVLVMDIRMPVLDGLAVTKRIQNLTVGTRVILMSSDIGAYVAKTAREAGARGYLRKDDLGKQLLPAIEAVHYGEEFFTTE
jgi:DNA-binding NarL/FixJ family response regulator